MRACPSRLYPPTTGTPTATRATVSCPPRLLRRRLRDPLPWALTLLALLPLALAAAELLLRVVKAADDDLALDRLCVWGPGQLPHRERERGEQRKTGRGGRTLQSSFAPEAVLSSCGRRDRPAERSTASTAGHDG